MERESDVLGICSTSASLLDLLDTIRDLDHELCLGDVRIFGSNFCQGVGRCLLHFFLVAYLNVVVKGTSICVTCRSYITEVLIVCDVFRADIAVHLGQLRFLNELSERV
jgi:hypothetical protein